MPDGKRPPPPGPSPSQVKRGLIITQEGIGPKSLEQLAEAKEAPADKLARFEKNLATYQGFLTELSARARPNSEEKRSLNYQVEQLQKMQESLKNGDYFTLTNLSNAVRNAIGEYHQTVIPESLKKLQADRVLGSLGGLKKSDLKAKKLKAEDLNPIDLFKDIGKDVQSVTASLGVKFEIGTPPPPASRSPSPRSPSPTADSPRGSIGSDEGIPPPPPRRPK